MSQLQHHHLAAPLLLSLLSHSTILWRLLRTFFAHTVCRRMPCFQQLGCSMWSSHCSLYKPLISKETLLFNCPLNLPATSLFWKQNHSSPSSHLRFFFLFSVLPKRLPCQPQPLHCFAFNFGVLQWCILSFLFAKAGQLYCSPFILVGKQLRF